MSSSQGLYLYTNTGKPHTQTLNTYALSEIRTHDRGFRANEDSTRLRRLGYRDRRYKGSRDPEFERVEISPRIRQQWESPHTKTEIVQKEFNVWAVIIKYNCKEVPTNPEPIIIRHAYRLYAKRKHCVYIYWSNSCLCVSTSQTVLVQGGPLCRYIVKYGPKICIMRIADEYIMCNVASQSLWIWTALT
jgi:hypothetical protein